MQAVRVEFRAQLILMLFLRHDDIWRCRIWILGNGAQLFTLRLLKAIRSRAVDLDIYLGESNFGLRSFGPRGRFFSWLPFGYRADSTGSDH